MDRPGVRNAPEGVGEQIKLEETGWEVTCGAQTTPRLWNRWSDDWCVLFALALVSTQRSKTQQKADENSLFYALDPNCKFTINLLAMDWIMQNIEPDKSHGKQKPDMMSWMWSANPRCRSMGLAACKSGMEVHAAGLPEFLLWWKSLFVYPQLHWF